VTIAEAAMLLWKTAEVSAAFLILCAGAVAVAAVVVTWRER
jgi:hypothetical protein